MTFPRFDIVAAAVADPTRARLMCLLMDGRAFTNKELASGTAVTPQTVSGHMARMIDLGLVTAEKSGRAVYHRLANADVAQLLEQMAQLSPDTTLYHRHKHRSGAGDAVFARCCYNHLAGELGVSLTKAMIARGDIEASQGALILSPAGQARLDQLGVPNESKGLRPCLDWTERRHHMSGPLANSMLNWFLEQNWLRRSDTPRVLTLTRKGEVGFKTHFGVGP